MSSKDSTNSSMIASDYKEPHDLPSLPAGLSADSLLVSALTEGTRKSSMRDLSASRFAGGDTSGLPRSPTKSVVINLPEEPPSKRMRTHTNAAPIDVVVSGMCLSFSSTYRAKSPSYRERMMMSMTRARNQEPLQRISCLKERPNLLRGPTSTFTLHRYH